jgi:putative glycosyltransferase
MKISIVSTLFLSQETIPEFCQRVALSANGLADESYEIILVDDGSPDNSLQKALEMQTINKKIKIIELSRNFGHHRAMMTGLSHAKGEYIFLIDSDLEEKPEYLKDFHGSMIDQQADVIYGVQSSRKGGLFEKVSGNWFWKILNIISGQEFPKNISTIRLMSQAYVKALILHQEREIFIAGLWLITGFNQQPFLINKLSHSRSSYSLKLKIELLINSITSFSNKPLVAIFYAGLFIFIAAFIYTLFLIFQWAFLLKPSAGWTSVMASVWLLGGMIISFIGVIGIYLSKVFTETKNRPYSIVKKVHEEN